MQVFFWPRIARIFTNVLGINSRFGLNINRGNQTSPVSQSTFVWTFSRQVTSVRTLTSIDQISSWELPFTYDAASSMQEFSFATNCTNFHERIKRLFVIWLEYQSKQSAIAGLAVHLHIRLQINSLDLLYSRCCQQ